MGINFSNLAARFRLQGRFQDAVPFGTGHIHDTFLIRMGGAGGVHQYIMQRVNQEVFRDPDALMANIDRVTGHLRSKILARGGNPDRQVLYLVPTERGELYFRTPEGDIWRSYRRILNARTFDEPRSRAQVRAAGQAYGAFLRDLEDFPPEKLHLSIPDFHHTARRYLAFKAAVNQDAAGRAGQAGEEIAFVEQRAELTGRIVAALERGDLPVRSTHNDTKLNNVMIDDATGEGLCVVDLDTVMPGSTLYDFGDAIRAIANSAAEDETDLAKVQFRHDYFEDFTQGYLETARTTLTPGEIAQFPFSAILMTLECGIRFLADHLNGDIYFKTSRDNHNLDRCRTQFKLVREMEAQLNRMTHLVDRYR